MSVLSAWSAMPICRSRHPTPVRPQPNISGWFRHRFTTSDRAVIETAPSVIRRFTAVTWTGTLHDEVHSLALDLRDGLEPRTPAAARKIGNTSKSRGTRSQETRGSCGRLCRARGGSMDQRLNRPRIPMADRRGWKPKCIPEHRGFGRGAETSRRRLLYF